MSNSPLISGTLLSPNCTKPRNHAIDTITIHCFVGQVTGKRGCEVFQPTSRKASCNYVVGKDGDIWLCVDEANRSWCTGGTDSSGNPIYVNGISGAINDQRAVTIEVASDTVDPYTVTDAASEALIKLVADIAKRNGMGTLKWKADKSLVGNVAEQNMTVHRWFAIKACPGDYLYERMGDIAAKANAINFPPVTQEPEEGSDETVSEPVVKTEPADWAKEAWDKAKTKVGRDGQTILDGTRPWDAITRQEVAVVLDRCGLLEGGEKA